MAKKTKTIKAPKKSKALPVKEWLYEGGFSFVYKGTEPIKDTEETPNAQFEALTDGIWRAIEAAGFEVDMTTLNDEPRELWGREDESRGGG